MRSKRKSPYPPDPPKKGHSSTSMRSKRKLPDLPAPPKRNYSSTLLGMTVPYHYIGDGFYESISYEKREIKDIDSKYMIDNEEFTIDWESLSIGKIDHPTISVKPDYVIKRININMEQRYNSMSIDTEGNYTVLLNKIFTFIFARLPKNLAGLSLTLYGVNEEDSNIFGATLKTEKPDTIPYLDTGFKNSHELVEKAFTFFQDLARNYKDNSVYIDKMSNIARFRVVYILSSDYNTKAFGSKLKTSFYNRIFSLKNNESETTQRLYRDFDAFMEKNDFGLFVPSAFKQCIVWALINAIKRKKDGNFYTKKDELNKKDKELFKKAKKEEFVVERIVPIFCEHCKAEIEVYDIYGKSKIYHWDKSTTNKKTRKGKILVMNNHASSIIEGGYQKYQDELLNYESNLKTNDVRPIKKLSNEIKDRYKKRKGLTSGYLAFDFETYKEGEDRDVAPFAVGLSALNLGDFKYKDWWIDDGCDEKAILDKHKLINNFTNELIEIIQNDFIKTGKSRNYIVFSHNGGSFDVPLISKILLEHPKLHLFYQEMSQPMITRNNKIMNFSVSLKIGNNEKGFKKAGEIKFRDSMCLINSPLAALTKDLLGEKNSKEKTPTDWESLTEKNLKERILFNKERKDTMSKYLQKDCSCILDSLVKFDKILNEIFKEEKKFSVLDKMSLSGISKTLFLRTIYDKMEEEILHMSFSEDKLFRKFYFGGRTQTFYIGVVTGKMYYYDFNSLYPSVMVEKLPYGKYKILYPKDIKDTKKIFGFVECRVKNLKGVTCKIPAVGMKFENRYLFPYLKKYCTVNLSSDEYHYIQSLGQYRIKLEKVYQYKGCKFYKEFVERLYKIKEEIDSDPKKSNDALRFIIKIILNSAYGLWALKRESGENTEFYYTRSKSGMIHLYNQFTNRFVENNLKGIDFISEKIVCLTYKDIVDCDEMNVGLAAFITAKARIRLHQLMKYITDKGYKVFYCDTDSVITDYEFKEEEQDQEKKFFGISYKLGDLKSEVCKKGQLFDDTIITDLVVRSPKNYSFKTNKGWEVVKLKGFNVHQNFHIIKEEENPETKEKYILCEDPYKPSIDYPYALNKDEKEEDKPYIENHLKYDHMAYLERNNRKLVMNLPVMRGGLNAVKKGKMTWGRNIKELRPRDEGEFVFITKGLLHKKEEESYTEVLPFVMTEGMTRLDELYSYSLVHYISQFKA